MVNLDRKQIRQAVFDGIMDYYGLSEADDDDQTEASTLVDAIMERIDDKTANPKTAPPSGQIIETAT